ncbi:carbohydrate-binding protein [Aquimarina sp. ERC-38]|uniref:CBM35 domain-containing protein n=1 Tax=Aquimarina sp. ERC-38 TaxID=2949996 RepID=UPI002247A488|nr:CBM35 domain-containing protein [Aquimarina sp. ERC-38]UZO79629.1 carbohydrate-binding protein [Aquimarina sp. ERC-38]
MTQHYLLTLLLLLTLSVRSQSVPQTYEAESSLLGGAAKVNTNHIGFTGSGFVDQFTIKGASAAFTIEVAEAGSYYVTLRYSNGTKNDNTLSLYVNDVDVRQTILKPTSQSWKVWGNKTEILELNEGTNTIRYQHDTDDSGFVNLDHIWLSKLAGNGVIGTPILKDQYSVVVQDYVQLPNTANNKPPRLNTFAFFEDRKFVGEEREGKIYELIEEGQAVTYQLFLDTRKAIAQNTGRNLNTQSSMHGGLRGIAFHPDFATNGKFYTSVMEDRPSNPADFNYISDSSNPIDADGVLVEWTYDFALNRIDSTSYREVFRIGMPVYDHPIKQIAFNRYAAPGDEDYGLLYVTHGDGSVQSATAGGGLNNDALGKILRIDPLANDESPYTVPVTNPFVGDDAYLDEIYALGFRNPHTLSFNQHRDGKSYLISGEAGRDNIEEVNLVYPGANYGWANREGTFVHLNSGGGIVEGLSPLPENEAELGYTYPAAQWGHEGDIGKGFVGQAIAGGYVYTSPDQNIQQYIFVDFANSGRLFYCNFDDLLASNIQLDVNDPLRSSPSSLTQAQIYEYSVYYDDDSDPSTPAIAKESMKDIIDDDENYDGSNRADIRFGQDQEGIVYMLNKRNGRIYTIQTVTPVIPPTFTFSYEAEDAKTNGVIGTKHPGFRGTGFVEYLTRQGRFVTFEVEVPEEDLYIVDMRYAAGSPNGPIQERTMSLYVNQQKVESINFEITGSWRTRSNKLLTIPLNKGSNTVTFQYDPGDTGYINIDYIDLKKSTYQAEDASTNAIIGDKHANFAGTGFVEYLTQQGRFVSFDIDVSQSGTYQVDARYAAQEWRNATQDRTMSLYLNDTLVDQIAFPVTSSWSEWANSSIDLPLEQGINKLRYEFDPGDTGFINLDYIVVSQNIKDTVAAAITSHLNNLITEKSEEVFGTLYPNPVRTNVSLAYKGNSEKVQISVMDMYGNKVYSQVSSSQDVLFTMSNLKKGMYFITLKDNSQTVTRKIFKE